MLIRHTNLKFLFFLNHYDLINKYRYKNFYVIPFYTKLSFKIFLKGFFNKKLFKKHLDNFLLIYFFCFNSPQTHLKLSRIKKKKIKTYKVKLFLNYSIMKKKILLSIYNLFFIFIKTSYTFFFSIQAFIFSKFSGKLFYNQIKIITFLPHNVYVDSFEQRYISFLQNSKIFLTFTLKNILTLVYYNFYKKPLLINKNFLKNFLLLWCLI